MAKRKPSHEPGYPGGDCDDTYGEEPSSLFPDSSTSASHAPSSSPSQLLRCEQRRPGLLAYHPLPPHDAIDFLAFLDRTPPCDVARLFCELLRDLATRSLRDFHLRIDGESRGRGGGRGGGGGGRGGSGRGWGGRGGGRGRDGGNGGYPSPQKGRVPPFRGGRAGGEFPAGDGGGRWGAGGGAGGGGGGGAQEQRAFAVEVMFGEQHEGPVAVDVPQGCIACNPLAPLFTTAPGAAADAAAGAAAGGDKSAGADTGADGESGRSDEQRDGREEGEKGDKGDPAATAAATVGAGGEAAGAGAAAAAESGEAGAAGAGGGGGGSNDGVITSGDLILREYESNQPHMRVSLDAQGRAGLIITPVRHVESLTELNDSELYEFFHTAAAAVQRERVVFSRMVVNHGSYRNLPHLHLKVFLDEGSFEEAKRGWEGERVVMWEKLMRLRPAKTAFVCKAFARGRCRFGSNCRNLHSTGGSS
ncbi:unnamed protein product [Closterium sp. NIES-54]